MHPFVSILIQILVKLKFLNHQGNRKLVQKLHNLRNQGSTCREVDGATFGTRYWDVQKIKGSRNRDPLYYVASSTHG